VPFGSKTPRGSPVEVQRVGSFLIFSVGAGFFKIRLKPLLVSPDYQNMYSAYLVPAVLALVLCALGFPSTQPAKLNQPRSLLPSQDSFYIPPTNFSSSTPGSILRFRTAPIALTNIFNASATAYQILFRTTNSTYSPSWSTTTLFIPQHPSNFSGGYKALLSYQIPYNTADVDDSPSYALQSTSNLATGLILSDIQRALQAGWYVNVPDFEGPLASFGLGVTEGHAVLDSIRAVLSPGLGVLSEEKTRIVMWGYSGGSIASEFAAELQSQYAPELMFSGMAIGGLVPNVSALIEVIDGTPAAGLVVSLLLGSTSQDGAAREVLIKNLKSSGPFNKTGFMSARNMSYAETAATFANQSILSSYFITSNNDTSILNDPIVKSTVDNNWYMSYHGTPRMPMYIYKAIHDEYSPVAETDALVERYCDVGGRILYERNELGNHLDEYTNGNEAAWGWLKKAVEGTLDGKQGGIGCTVRNVSVGISVHEAFAPP
jgi:hypothetical protein